MKLLYARVRRAHGMHVYVERACAGMLYVQRMRSAQIKSRCTVYTAYTYTVPVSRETSRRRALTVSVKVARGSWLVDALVSMPLG